MLRRFTGADWAATLAIAFGLLAVYLPWYSYTSGSAHVTVNGFRASVLGDIFFLVIAATALLELMLRGLIDDVISPHLNEAPLFSFLAVAGGLALLLQIVVAAAGGSSLGPGILIALVSVAGLSASAWVRRQGDPRGRRVTAGD